MQATGNPSPHERALWTLRFRLKKRQLALTNSKKSPHLGKLFLRGYDRH